MIEFARTFVREKARDVCWLLPQAFVCAALALEKKGISLLFPTNWNSSIVLPKRRRTFVWRRRKCVRCRCVRTKNEILVVEERWLLFFGAQNLAAQRATMRIMSFADTPCIERKRTVAVAVPSLTETLVAFAKHIDVVTMPPPREPLHEAPIGGFGPLLHRSPLAVCAIAATWHRTDALQGKSRHTTRHCCAKRQVGAVLPHVLIAVGVLCGCSVGCGCLWVLPNPPTTNTHTHTPAR